MPATHDKKCDSCGKLFESDAPESTIQICDQCETLSPTIVPRLAAGNSSVADGSSAIHAGNEQRSKDELNGDTGHGDIDQTLDSAVRKPAAEEPSSPLSKPKPAIGRFELRSNLGYGAFGRVYLAYDPLLDREVALKVPRFPPDEPQLVERFLIEAKAAARLRHPNIVTTFECGRVEDDYYIATEFVDGMPLSKKIRKGGFDERQAAIWVRDLADALTYAHSENIVHRDIKPPNIMVSHAGRPELMDFGLAKIQNDDEGMTVDGSVVGTPAYMPPEQARGDVKATGPLSDQYSLGAVFYELLTKQKPFSGSLHSVLTQVTGSAEPESIRKISPNISSDLQAICEKTLSKDPGDRYESTADLAQDIERWLNGEPILARRINPIERMWRWCRRNRAVASLLFLVASMLTVGAAVSAVAAINFRTLAQKESASADLARIKELEAERLAKDAELRLADMFTFTGLAAAREGDPAQAVLWFANAVKQSQSDPMREQANRVRFNSWARQTPVAVKVMEHPGEWIKQIQFDPSGRYLLAIAVDFDAYLWDLKEGKTVIANKLNTHANAAAWSPDGKWLAQGFNLGVEINQVGDWSLVANSELQGLVECLTFSPDGKWLAVSIHHGDTNFVRLWNCADRDYVGPQIDHPAKVKKLAFSANSRMLATSCSDGSARVYDVPLSGNEPQSKFAKIPNFGPIFADSPAAPIFLNDDSALMTLPSNRPGKAELFSTTDGQSVAELSVSTKTVQNYVNLFAATPDRGHLVLGTSSGAAFWDTGTQERVGQWMPHTNVMTSVAFHQDGEILLTGSLDRTARLWSLPSGRPLSPSIKHEDEILEVAYSPDASQFATCQKNGVVKLWRFTPNPSSDTVRPTDWHDAFLRSSNDGRFVVPAHWNRRRTSRAISIIDTSSGEDVGGHLQAAGILNATAISSDGSDIMGLSSKATASALANTSNRTPRMRSERGLIELWDRKSGKPLCESILTPSEPIAGAFHPTQKLAAVLCAGGQLLFVDTDKGKIQDTLLHSGDYRAGFMIRGYLRFTRDGKSLATWGLGNQVKVWDVAQRKERFILEARSWASDVTFSRDSELMVVSGADDQVRIVNMSTGKDEVDPLIHPDWVFTANFSPDESLLVTAGRDRTARVWDWRAGVIAAPDLEHDDEVFDVVFANGGVWIVTTCRDGSVRFWDRHSGKPLAPPLEVVKESYSIAVNPSRNFAVVSGKEGLYAFDLQSFLDTKTIEIETRLRLGELIAGRRLLPKGGVANLKSSEWQERWNSLQSDEAMRELMQYKVAPLQ